jgi:hypothetical protein
LSICGGRNVSTDEKNGQLSDEERILVYKMANVLLAFSIDLNDDEAIVRRLMTRFGAGLIARFINHAIEEAKRQLREGGR